jgi:hypothetical protein
MPRSQQESGLWKASTGLTRRPETAGNFPVSKLIVAALTRLAIGLVISALIIIGLTNPGGAPTTSGIRTGSTPSSPQQQDDNVTLFAQCQQSRWQAKGRDRGTARATLGKGLAVSAFPLYVPV